MKRWQREERVWYKCNEKNLNVKCSTLSRQATRVVKLFELHLALFTVFSLIYLNETKSELVDVIIVVALHFTQIFILCNNFTVAFLLCSCHDFIANKKTARKVKFSRNSNEKFVLNENAISVREKSLNIEQIHTVRWEEIETRFFHHHIPRFCFA